MQILGVFGLAVCVYTFFYLPWRAQELVRLAEKGDNKALVKLILLDACHGHGILLVMRENRHRVYRADGTIRYWVSSPSPELLRRYRNAVLYGVRVCEDCKQAMEQMVATLWCCAAVRFVESEIDDANQKRWIVQIQQDQFRRVLKQLDRLCI